MKSIQPQKQFNSFGWPTIFGRRPNDPSQITAANQFSLVNCKWLTNSLVHFSKRAKEFVEEQSKALRWSKLSCVPIQLRMIPNLFVLSSMRRRNLEKRWAFAHRWTKLSLPIKSQSQSIWLWWISCKLIQRAMKLLSSLCGVNGFAIDRWL